MIADSEFGEEVVVLERGDRLYLFSDGVYEERNVSGEHYGMPRMQARAVRGASLALKSCVEGVLDEAVAWGSSDGLTDDAALLGVEWRGAPSG